MKTFFQICVIITVSLAILNIAVNFVSGLGVFPISYSEGTPPIGSTNATMENLTDVRVQQTSGADLVGLDALFVAVLGGGALAAIVIAWVTRSTAIIGVWILSAVFWYSYGRTHVILDLQTYLPTEFILMGTIAMGFVWVGAVAGMLSGSG